MLLTRNNFTRLLFVVLLLATLALMPVLGASLNSQPIPNAGPLFSLFESAGTDAGATDAIACNCGDPSQGGGGGCC